ncbi:MAG TPA: hypothetical protein VNJ54_21195, partial [Plantibacter sp.]|uniref:hypothetical protein n=1 Tax=Plantibacter sp. TaxID=1871045 RepID=UPI002D0EF96B|nr:hypothetical protein [Plantibacter sp.]
ARLLASVNGSGFTYPVRLSEGSVQVSASSPMRRRGSVSIAAEVGAPEADPFRTEIRAEYGITRPNGTTYWVPVGTFVVTENDESGPGLLSLKLEDRWRRVVNARFLVPVTTSGNTVAAITSLLQGADGRITVVDETGLGTTHRPQLWERDRDKAILDLAKSIGAVVAFDPMGVARILPVGSLANPIAWRVYGGDGGVLVQARRGVSQGSTYNAASVLGEPPDLPPVRSVRTLTTAGSPIRYGGPFASRPRFYRSPLIVTQAQADVAADALLARITGVAKTVSADTAPHPGLDADDVIEVEVGPGVYQLHLVDEFTLPLGPGVTSLSTRTSVVEEGE